VAPAVDNAPGGTQILIANASRTVYTSFLTPRWQSPDTTIVVSTGVVDGGIEKAFHLVMFALYVCCMMY
jgi:hypothetical protein